MDYLKNHKKITSDEFKVVKDFIIDQLKIEDSKGHIFDVAVNNVRNLLHSQFINNNLAYRFPDNSQISCNALVNHKRNYNPKKVYPILKTLENVVFENFKSNMELLKSQNINQIKIENLTFETFYPEILKLVVYRRCYSRLSKYDFPYLFQAIELFYDKDNYDEFSIKFLVDDADNLSENDFREVFKKFHKKFPVEITSKSKITDDVEISKYLIKYKTQIDKIDDNEMALLFYICTSSDYKFNRSELIKLIIICGNINNDFKIFESISSNSTLYNKIIKANKPYKDKMKWYSFIDNIINKIEIFKLSQTNEILLNMK